MKQLKLFFALFAMLALGVGNAWGAGNYVKVTTAPSDWSGDYLIVYESGKVAFNGALTTLDAVSNTVSVTITNNQIAATDAMNKAKFTINASGHIKSASGYYIGQSSNANGLKSSKTQSYTNTLTINSDASVHIVSGGAYLRYNPTSGQTRFRYYKSSSYTGQKAIHLYKYIEEQSGGETPDPTPVTITLNKNELNLQAGATESLTATVTGSTESVTWSSSATGVASVDNTGKVTAVAAGDATITAAIGEVKATCVVTVTAATTPEEPGTGGEASTVTFTYADLKGQGASGSGADFTGATKENIHMSGKGNGNNSYVQIYANNYLTFTPTNATITKIVLTATTNSYIKTWKASEGTIEVSGAEATWTGNSTSTVTLTNTASAQARITKMDVTYTVSGSDEPEAEIVKTLKSIAVSDMTTIYEQGSEFSFDGKCTATYSVTKDGAAQADQTAKVEPTSVSTPDMNQLGTQTVTVTYTEGEVTKTAGYTITIEEAPTYNFRKIEGFSDWESGYGEHVVEYSDAKVTFVSANKQSNTITDQPVTKGGDVSLVLKDGMNIATVKWVCTQWGTKEQTITLHYSKDGGVTYTSTGITSENFTISSDNLPAGTNAVKITFSSANQVGIKSCTITKVEAAAITQVPAPQFSLQGGAYDGTQSVTLTCTMADATIYYTTDGATPTTSSAVYSTAIQVAENMTIKAYAVKEGLEDSPVVEATYEISAPADVVLDFTTNTWLLPEGNANKATEKTDFTNGDYTVSIAAPTAYYFDSNNLFLGKKDAYIVLPIFNKPIVKIVCEGVSTGSGSVTFNVFVDDEAVSTAVTSCKVDQTFLITEDKQVANVAHVIKVTNENNLRIAKIKIYLGEAPAVERPIISGEEEFAGSTEVSITCATSGAKIYYTIDGTTPTTGSTKYTAAFTLSETTTVKAIAYNSTTAKSSTVAEKTFTKTAITTKTIEEFIASQGGACYLEGTVSNITNTTYGNFDLTDETGTIYIYGCLNANGEAKKFAELGVKEGDLLKVQANVYEFYKEKHEAKNVVYVSHVSNSEEPEAPELPTTAENATFVFNTAEGLADLGIAYPTTEDGTGKKTDIENNTTVISNGVGLTMTGGNTTATRIWLTASGALDLRVYKGATLTFAVADGYEIKKVVFDGSALTNLAVGGVAVDGATKTWEGSQKSVTFDATDGVKINTIAVTVAYTRSVTSGKYGTICLPYGSTKYSGATFFEIAYKETGKVYIDEVTALEAGVPYIFQAKSSKLSVTYEGTPDVATSNNGLHGTFTEIADVAAHTSNKGYILINNVIRFCEANCNVPANRAYIVLDEISTEQTPAPVNRRRVGMSVQGENETTGIEDLFTTEAPAKVIENGQLIIIRDGVKYNVQGQKL